MDIITHAVVGAAIGAKFGHPVVGAIAGVIPDLCLGASRKPLPTNLYNATHSLAVLLLALPFTVFGASVALTVFFALASHLLLDLPTHGRYWAPTLLWPSTKRFHLWFAREWEFFNRSWWVGLALAIAIILLFR